MVNEWNVTWTSVSGEITTGVIGNVTISTEYDACHYARGPQYFSYSISGTMPNLVTEQEYKGRKPEFRLD